MGPKYLRDGESFTFPADFGFTQSSHGNHAPMDHPEPGNPEMQPEALAKGGKFIQGAIKHPGALHRALNVPEGQKIPEAKIDAATHSDDPTMRRRANFAKTLKGLSHHRRKKE